jgi:hypothetical protein
MKEGKYDEAKSIFKKGADNGQQLCFGDFADLLMWKTNFRQFLTDYNIISYNLKNMCLIICFEKLSKVSFFYSIYYLSKHSSFKQKILYDFAKYAQEIFKIREKYFQPESIEFIDNNFVEEYAIENSYAFGIMIYYGIQDIIKSDKERALICFKKSYLLAKEKGYNYKKRLYYLYIFKCRKY